MFQDTLRKPTFFAGKCSMTLPATEFELHPMDIFSLCQYFRKFKEKEGPRALRFILEPDKPVRLVFEPWYETLTFHHSLYKGSRSKTIRIWERRRLLILERLIPVAKTFKVVLLGSGLPSFFLADLGDMTFTLGLSGWTTNDWSRTGNFDLVAPRGNVDLLTQQRVFEGWKETWFETSDALAKKLNLDSSVVSSALTSYTQAGRVIYDLNLGVYRVRELTQEPLNFKALRFGSEQEKVANELIEQSKIKNLTSKVENEHLNIQAVIKDKNQTIHTRAVIDKDQRLVDASCSCSFFGVNQLKKGPCEHILATRIAFEKKQEN